MIVTTALPSLQQSKLARRALNSGEPMSRVLAFFDNKFDGSQITAGIEKLRTIQRSRRDTNHRWKSIVDFDHVINIPEAVKDDRDHRATLVPKDTTALRMGDPLPGYSAADKAPSIVAGRAHDPLDDLMFGRRKIGVMAG